MCSKRELEVETSREKTEAAAVVKMQERASTAAAKATSMSDLLKNRDVINVICGEDEAELWEVRKMLCEENQQHGKTRRAKDQLEQDLVLKNNTMEAQTRTLAALQAKMTQLENTKKESIHETETMCNFIPKTRLTMNEKIIIFGRH